jgi:hypothetical protein
MAESRGSTDSTVSIEVADRQESPDAVVEDAVHDEHRVTAAPLGVLDHVS